MNNDWRLILKELQAKGFTLYKIAVHISVPLPSVKLWEQGSEPKHSAGERLLEFYRLHVSHETEKV